MKYKKMKAIALSLVFPMMMSFYGCKKEEKPKKKQNLIGYEDVNPYFNFGRIKDENFVLLDVGDNDSVRTFRQDKKMKFCNEKDISFGIIISSNATTQDEIYQDVNYAKSIIEEYNVDFPVYLKIDNIIQSPDLMPDVMVKLINDFLQKGSTNGMFVGINGTDSNLAKLKSYGDANDNFDIFDYDVYLVQESEEFKFDGNYTIIKKLDGSIENLNPKYNCEPIIKNDLNNSKLFLKDSVYVVKEGDSLSDLAFSFGLSERELLNYNEITKSKFKPGLKLSVPSSIDKNLSEENTEYVFEKAKEPLVGIDISHHQAPNEINWDEVKNKVDFVIVRTGHGVSNDRHYESHYKNCVQKNIPIGMYHYNDIGHNSDFEEFKRQVSNQSDFAMSRIKDKKFDYPLYFDLENSEILNFYVKDFTKEELQFFIDDWKAKVIKQGYVPGLYCGEYNYNNYIKNNVNLDGMELWVAGYVKKSNSDPLRFYYTKEHSYEEIKEEKSNHFNTEYPMHQSTENGVGFGIDKGIDVNISFYNYEKKIINEDAKNNYTDSIENEYNHKFKRNNIQKAYDTLPEVIGVAAVTIGAILKKKMKNRKNRKGVN